MDSCYKTTCLRRQFYHQRYSEVHLFAQFALPSNVYSLLRSIQWLMVKCTLIYFNTERLSRHKSSNTFADSNSLLLVPSPGELHET